MDHQILALFSAICTVLVFGGAGYYYKLKEEKEERIQKAQQKDTHP